ncbi:hypothetical protein H072_2643 [Dactylellina haptotyla CBS 200.50]|uniref:F-box domain-containing protein n=1 Tax=Dactylellina haptotyla (strain CBS 200.50) TaxID=1284197 RepID=S8AKD6_DACHA|nr:hypothetical protein H072_2643 [Dactylellina haptotyla CBS 200.50]
MSWLDLSVDPQLTAQNLEPYGSDNITGGCRLPAEIQMLVLEQADWKLQPTLAQVCRFWREFIQNSPTVRLNRYFPVVMAKDGFNGSAGETEYPRPRPWIHRSLGYLRQYTLVPAAKRLSFEPCKIEILTQPPNTNSYLPYCKIWPDMKWGFFKDDTVTIYPGLDTEKLRIAERELVIGFRCRSECDRGNCVVGLGPVTVIGTYLSFVSKTINSEAAKCRRDCGGITPYAPSPVVELYMNKPPILVFSPAGYDTDTLRIWLKANMMQCEFTK